MTRPDPVRSMDGGLPRASAQAINLSRGGVVLCDRLMLADTSASRRRGLLSHTRLESGGGLYMTPCEWLHTFRMQFSIDVAFLSCSGIVLAVHHELKPSRISRPVWRAHGALELPAGTLRLTGTERGDLVLLLNRDTAQNILS